MDGFISDKMKKVLQDDKARKQLRQALTGGNNKVQIDGRTYRVVSLRKTEVAEPHKSSAKF